MAKKKQSESGKNDGPKIHKTLMEDLKQGGFKRTLKQDFKAIYDFYIDKKTKKRLAAMGKVKRGFNIVYLVLKSMVLKLTPVRRILLFVSVYLSFIGPYQLSSSGSNITLNFRFIGYMILLLILILELKDKITC